MIKNKCFYFREDKADVVETNEADSRQLIKFTGRTCK